MAHQIDGIDRNRIGNISRIDGFGWSTVAITTSNYTCLDGQTKSYTNGKERSKREREKASDR